MNYRSYLLKLVNKPCRKGITSGGDDIVLLFNHEEPDSKIVSVHDDFVIIINDRLKYEIACPIEKVRISHNI